MPTYRIDIPGKGTFRLDSEQEMSDAEIQSAAADIDAGGGDSGGSDLSAPSAAPPQPDEGTYAKQFGGGVPEDANFLQKYAGITGRRVGEAIDAAVGLPGAVGDIFTGGRNGRLDALLRTVRGVASPFSALLAPVEAAGEEAVTGLTGNEQWGRLAGDVTGAASTLGMGLLAKGGKLGDMGLKFAEVLGAGRPKTWDDMVKRDPQLAFVTERVPTRETASSELELMARTGASMEDLAAKARSQPSEPTIAEVALDLKRPSLAEIALRRADAETELWLEHAKENNIVSEMPPEPRMTKDNLAFVSPNKKDLNIFQTLGTTATRANAFGPEAGGVAMEAQLTDANIVQAVNNRQARTATALTGLSDADSLKGTLAYNLNKVDELLAAPETVANQAAKNWAKWLSDKFEVDRQAAIPRMRDIIRNGIARIVNKEMEGATTLEKAQEVERRVLREVPDDFRADGVILNIFPGFYQIKDEKGTLLKTASNGLDWKTKVKELVDGGMDASKIKIESQAYFDSDLLHLYKGRIERSYSHLANALVPTSEEIQAAAKGEYFLQGAAGKPFQLLQQMGERLGKGGNYVEDMKNLLNTYDRSLERWMQVSELKERVRPQINEIAKRYPQLAITLRENINNLWGHRMPFSQHVDNFIAATPILRDVVAPMALERMLGGVKNGLVTGLLRWNPRFHAVNFTQTLATLWPIADFEEIAQGVKLRASDAGQALLKRHGVVDTSKVEGASRGLGISEKFNQETAFLTMYNRARKFGLTDAQAADYGTLRGRVYSQFMGLTTDQPIAFRKLDPWGMMTMFQRFPVKQTEMFIDILKDKNYPAAAKWLGVQLALGGFKAATMGQAGWLTYKLYKDIEGQYGKTAADVFHVGLPALLGTDLSSSIQLYNPPFGENFAERVGNFAAGPLMGLVGSVTGAMLSQSAPEPSALKRGYESLAARIPAARWLKALPMLIDGVDYDFKDPEGRLKYKGDWRDLFKYMAGFKPAGGTMGVYDPADPRQMRPAEIDTFADAMMDMTQKRSDVLDYAASRYGQALASGVDLGDDIQTLVRNEVDHWNNLWPEFAISHDDILTRAKARSQTVLQGTAQRIMKGTPPAIRNSELFAPAQQTREAQPPPPGLPFEFFGGG